MATKSATESTSATAAPFSPSSSGAVTGSPKPNVNRRLLACVIASGSDGVQHSSQSVTAAAEKPFEQLDELDEKSPHPLTKRIHIPITAGIAEDIQGGRLTARLRSWLKGQNPGWEDEDLVELAFMDGDLFWASLCEQAANNGNRPVFDLIPKHISEGIEEDLKSKNRLLEALLGLIKFAGEVELDVCPNVLNNLTFLSHHEREVNRKTARFDHLTLNTNVELRAWLISREWPVDYADHFADLTIEEDIISELISHALELEDYEVIQSIPQAHAEMIVADLHSAVEGNQELLDFINANEPLQGGDPDAVVSDGGFDEA